MAEGAIADSSRGSRDLIAYATFVTTAGCWLLLVVWSGGPESFSDGWVAAALPLFFGVVFAVRVAPTWTRNGVAALSLLGLALVALANGIDMRPWNDLVTARTLGDYAETGVVLIPVAIGFIGFGLLGLVLFRLSPKHASRAGGPRLLLALALVAPSLMWPFGADFIAEGFGPAIRTLAGLVIVSVATAVPALCGIEVLARSISRGTSFAMYPLATWFGVAMGAFWTAPIALFLAFGLLDYGGDASILEWIFAFGVPASLVLAVVGFYTGSPPDEAG